MLTGGGFGVLEGARIYVPRRGPAIARVALDTATAPPATLVLAEAGGISLACAVAGGGVNYALLRWEGILVGGAGRLATMVEGAYRQLQIGDVLSAVAMQSGERLSDTISPTLRTLPLPFWTLGRCTAAAALDALAAAASAELGAPVAWRVLGDGSIWVGLETWPAAQLPGDAEVVEVFPAERRTVIAATVVPALFPGVELAGVGRVVAVEHFIEPDSVRTMAWT